VGTQGYPCLTGRLPVCAILRPLSPFHQFFFSALQLPPIIQRHLYLLFLLQFCDFSLTPYALAPAHAPAPTPAPVPASAPASRSADPAYAHGLEHYEEVPIVTSLDERLQQHAQIDIQEVYQAPHCCCFLSLVIYLSSNIYMLQIPLSCL
jgi:hypothetical protein